MTHHTPIARFDVAIYAREVGIQASVWLYAADRRLLAQCDFYRDQEYKSARISHLDHDHAVLTFRESTLPGVLDVLRNESPVAFEWDTASHTGSITSAAATAGQG